VESQTFCPQAKDSLLPELLEAKRKLAELEKENAAMKSAQVWTLEDLSSCGGKNTAAASAQHRGNKLKREWEAASAAASSVTSKKTSLMVVHDFSVEDAAVYNELHQQVVQTCWKALGNEAMFEQGTRPATVAEVEELADSSGYSVQDHLNWLDKSTVTWEFYLKEKEGRAEKEVVGANKYPKAWPRAPRTKVDDQVKKRKVAVLMELSRLVHEHLGEHAQGVPSAMQLHAFLKTSLDGMWAKANEPVVTGLCNLTPEIRNRYLVKLLQPNPLAWTVVKDVLSALWPRIREFEWVVTSKIELWDELRAIQAHIGDAPMEVDESGVSDGPKTEDSYDVVQTS